MNSKIKRWVLLAIAACGSDDAPTSVGDAAASLVASSDNAEQIASVLPDESIGGGDDSDSILVAPAGDADAIIATQENFRVMLSDEENAIGDFQHLWVTVERVGIQQGEGESGGWLEFEVPEETQVVDLVELQGEIATELISTDVPVGSYGKIFIHASDVRGELLSGELVELKLPSDKLQLNQPFEISEGSLTTFVFDITVVAAGNEKSGVKYILKPVIGESGADEPFIEKESKAQGGPPDGRGKPSDAPSSATTTQAAIATDDKRKGPPSKAE